MEEPVEVNHPKIASIPIQDRWIDEAVEELGSYNRVPVVDDFAKKAGLDPETFDLERNELDAIKASIRDCTQEIRFDDLVDYLDERKGCGKQLVFLWRLNRNEPGQLDKLRRCDKLKGLLGERGTRMKKLVWESPQPELAEVRYEPEKGPRSLTLKWVATRNYTVLEEGSDGLFFSRPETQRAVTLFHVNLLNGECELRIQSLPQGKGVKFAGNERSEFQTYRAEVEMFVELDHLVPVLIEPVAKQLIRKPMLPTGAWQALHPRGVRIGGPKLGPGLAFGQLVSLIGESFVQRIAFRWDCEQEITGLPLFFSLDGDGDYVDFNSKADASRVNFILRRIRELAGTSVRLPELKRLVEKYPQHERIISAIDYRFATLYKLRVHVADLTNDLWYRDESIRQVFQLLAREFPDLFSVPDDSGNVLVMKNKLRLRTDGVVGQIQRHAEDRGKPRWKKLAKPAVSVGYAVAILLYRELLSWLRAEFFEWLTGIPFILAQVVFLSAIAVSHAVPLYGGEVLRTVFVRLPKGTVPLVTWLLFGAEQSDELTRVFEAEYEQSPERAEHRNKAPRPADAEVASDLHE